jgi:hypothetical protein
MVLRILKGFLALFRNIPLLRPFQGCSIVRPRVLLDSMFLIPGDCNCLWQELSQSCRFPSVEVCEGAKTTLRSLPPGIPRANPPADNVYEFLNSDRHIQTGPPFHHDAEPTNIWSRNRAG